jgi:hypothetical protein
LLHVLTAITTDDEKKICIKKAKITVMWKYVHVARTVVPWLRSGYKGVKWLAESIIATRHVQLLKMDTAEYDISSVWKSPTDSAMEVETTIDVILWLTDEGVKKLSERLDTKLKERLDTIENNTRKEEEAKELVTSSTTVSREALVEFYQQHAPSKTKTDIDKILVDYAEKQADLLEGLRKQYGAVPRASDSTKQSASEDDASSENKDDGERKDEENEAEKNRKAKGIDCKSSSCKKLYKKRHFHAKLRRKEGFVDLRLAMKGADIVRPEDLPHEFKFEIKNCEIDLKDIQKAQIQFQVRDQKLRDRSQRHSKDFPGSLNQRVYAVVLDPAINKGETCSFIRESDMHKRQWDAKLSKPMYMHNYIAMYIGLGAKVPGVQLKLDCNIAGM